MKTLQYNFTTPEQSRRLLELGVPADSADCVITIITEDIYAINIIPNHRVFSDIKEELQLKRGKEIIPCWSAGRLIVIYELCTNTVFSRTKTRGYVYGGKIINEHNTTIVEDVMFKIEHHIINSLDGLHFDFSKLE